MLRTGGSEKGEDKIVLDIDIPLIMEGKDTREEYLQCVRNNETLVKMREYTDSEVKGYFWDNGVLKKLVRDGLGQEIHLTIVPKHLRTTILRLSHDFNGHLGVKKVKAILNTLYTWPGLLEDILKWKWKYIEWGKNSRVDATSSNLNPLSLWLLTLWVLSLGQNQDISIC